MPIISILISILIFVGYAIGVETQFYGENWFRYTQEVVMTTPTKEMETQESQFAIERIYLRWMYKHTDKLESRVTVEMFSSEKDFNGAGLKLKDGYVKFNALIPEGDITVGLQKNYFGRTYDWEYFPIEKCMEERYPIMNGSADYGISVGGYIPHGYGTWRLEAVNGEGYKATGSKINTELAYVADLRFIPMPGLTVGGSFVQENAGPDTLPYQARQYYTGLIRFTKGPVDIWLQGIGGQKGAFSAPTSQIGYMIFPKFHLGTIIDRDLEFLVRYDYWDPDVDKEDDGKFLYLSGFNYYFTRDVMLQVVVARDQLEAENSKPTDKIMLQLRWEWTSPKLGEI